MFKHWFKKKLKRESSYRISEEQTIGVGEKIVATENRNHSYKVIREISDKISSALESSTIPLWIGQLYMHYLDKNIPEDYNNPEWRNQELYFWLAEEDFSKKSLPPTFEDKEKKFFRIVNKIQIFKSTAIPWFGMPGGGLKIGFGDPNTPAQISTIWEQGDIEYLEIVELIEENLEILNDRNNYTLLAGNNIQVENNIFYLDGNPITLSLAYSIGLINVAKIV